MEIRKKKNKAYIFDTVQVMQCDLNRKLQSQFKGFMLSDIDKTTNQNRRLLKEKLTHDKMD